MMARGLLALVMAWPLLACRPAAIGPPEAEAPAEEPATTMLGPTTAPRRSLLVRGFAATVPADAIGELGLYAPIRRGVVIDKRGRGASFRNMKFEAYRALVGRLDQLRVDSVDASKTSRLPMGRFGRRVGGDRLASRAGFRYSATPAVHGLALEVGLELGASGSAFAAVESPRAGSATRTLLERSLVTVEEPGTLVLFTQTSRSARRYVLAALRYRVEPGCPLSGRTPIGAD